MREQLLTALRAYYTGNIEKHKMNIENLIRNNVGVAEHPDHMDTISKEVEGLAKFDENLQMLDKYFQEWVVAEKDVLDKLAEMHTDVLLIRSDLSVTKSEVAEHELILRGQSKMNGLVGEVRNIKTAQSTVQKMWVVMAGVISTVIAWLGLSD